MINRRRLLIAALAVIWLGPSMMAGAMALHVELEHPPGHDYQATPHVAELEAPAIGGQAQTSERLPHEHPGAALAASGVAVRRLLGLPAPHLGAHRAASTIAAETPRRGPVSSLLAPPGASGPPLLARLSTLRI